MQPFPGRMLLQIFSNSLVGKFLPTHSASAQRPKLGVEVLISDVIFLSVITHLAPCASKENCSVTAVFAIQAALVNSPLKFCFVLTLRTPNRLFGWILF